MGNLMQTLIWYDFKNFTFIYLSLKRMSFTRPSRVTNLFEFSLSMTMKVNGYCPLTFFKISFVVT